MRTKMIMSLMGVTLFVMGCPLTPGRRRRNGSLRRRHL